MVQNLWNVLEIMCILLRQLFPSLSIFVNWTDIDCKSSCFSLQSSTCKVKFLVDTLIPTKQGTENSWCRFIYCSHEEYSIADKTSAFYIKKLQCLSVLLLW